MRTKTWAAATLALVALVSCAPNGGDRMDQAEIPVACRLDGMTRDDRAREGVLLREHLGVYRDVRQHEGGYSYEYPPDPQLFARMAELVALEHRCCPFLSFQMEWQGGEASPWLHIGGGPRVKSFVASTFGERR